MVASLAKPGHLQIAECVWCARVRVCVCAFAWVCVCVCYAWFDAIPSQPIPSAPARCRGGRGVGFLGVWDYDLHEEGALVNQQPIDLSQVTLIEEGRGGQRLDW